MNQVTPSSKQLHRRSGTLVEALSSTSSINPEAGVAAMSVQRFCRATDISRSYFYALPEKMRPMQLKVGRKRLVIESPISWLRRIGTAA